MPSEYLRDVFARHGYPTRVIPNVVDLSRFRYRERRPLQPRVLSTQKSRALLPRRPRHRSVRAIQRRGARRHAHRRRLRQRGGAPARPGGVARRATPFDSPARSIRRRCRSCYAEHDIFVNASVLDNQPVSILEAFSAGLPVVSTSTGDIPLMVRHGEIGLLVAPGDPVRWRRRWPPCGALPKRLATSGTSTPGSREVHLAGRARPVGRSLCGAGAASTKSQSPRTRGESSDASSTLTPMARSSMPRHRGTGARLSRIREMSFAEVAYRGHQEAAKLLERVAAPRPLSGPSGAGFRSRAPAIATAERGAQARARRLARPLLCRRMRPGRPVRRFAIGCPPSASTSSAAATDTMVGRRFDLLGYRMLSFGDPIDWHLDPVWGRQSPLVHWSRIDALDPAVVGDSKVVWELNRHQWIVTLAQAWALTGDERYARRVHRIDRRVARGESARHRHQLGEQPRGRLPADLVVLDAGPPPRLSRAVGRVDDEGRLGDLDARGARATLSLVLLFAQHASDRRGARPVLRRHAVHRIPRRAALARARCAHPRRREPATGLL